MTSEFLRRIATPALLDCFSNPVTTEVIDLAGSSAALLTTTEAGTSFDSEARLANSVPAAMPTVPAMHPSNPSRNAAADAAALQDATLNHAVDAALSRYTDEPAWNRAWQAHAASNGQLSTAATLERNWTRLNLGRHVAGLAGELQKLASENATLAVVSTSRDTGTSSALQLLAHVDAARQRHSRAYDAYYRFAPGEHTAAAPQPQPSMSTTIEARRAATAAVRAAANELNAAQHDCMHAIDALKEMTAKIASDLVPREQLHAQQCRNTLRRGQALLDVADTLALQVQAAWPDVHASPAARTPARQRVQLAAGLRQTAADLRDSARTNLELAQARLDGLIRAVHTSAPDWQAPSAPLPAEPAPLSADEYRRKFADEFSAERLSDYREAHRAVQTMLRESTPFDMQLAHQVRVQAGKDEAGIVAPLQAALNSLREAVTTTQGHATARLRASDAALRYAAACEPPNYAALEAAHQASAHHIRQALALDRAWLDLWTAEMQGAGLAGLPPAELRRRQNTALSQIRNLLPLVDLARLADELAQAQLS